MQGQRVIAAKNAPDKLQTPLHGAPDDTIPLLRLLPTITRPSHHPSGAFPVTF